MRGKEFVTVRDNPLRDTVFRDDFSDENFCEITGVVAAW
jgi:hypothetical protein